MTDNLGYFQAGTGHNGRFFGLGKTLHLSEEGSKALIDGAPQGVLVIGKDGRIMLANAWAESMFGYSRGELAGQPIEVLIPKDLQSVHVSHRIDYFTHPRVRQMDSGLDLIGLRKDGSPFPAEISLNTIETDCGLLAIAFVTDITQRKQAEAGLRQSEKRYQSIFNHSSEAIFVMDMEQGSIIDVNPKACDMLGYSRDEMLSIEVASVHPSAEELAGLHDFSQLVFEGGWAQTDQISYITKDGRLLPAAISASSFNNGDQRRIVAMVRDITKQKAMEQAIQESRDELERRVEERTFQLEQANATLTNEIAERERLADQLLHSQKMESVGRMAGGVAHDFNNLLTVIRGYTNLILEGPEDLGSIRADLEAIDEATERAILLVDQLMTFSHRQVVKPETVSLNDLVLKSSPMLRRLIAEDIELVTLPAPDLWLVKVDPRKFEQVLMNLAVNASAAMPSGGALTIETSNITIDEDYASRHLGLDAGEYVVLSVSDTGFGMTDEVKQQIFDPFFTTKEIGKGTGLGLSICYGIVKQSGGQLEVESEPGQGSTFRVYVRRTSERHRNEPAPGESAMPKKGTETVLVAEDAPALRDLVVRVLRKGGYTVLEAANGEEALRVAQNHNGRTIDLLVTDVVMPQMGGLELIERFKTLRPDTRVLATSGYVHEAANETLAGIRFLQKPYLPAKLASTVRQVLDE